MHEPGLLCLWRTRVDRGDGQTEGRARALSPVLAVMHIACEVPRFPDRVAVAAFVTSTIDRYRARIQPLLDRELAAALARIDVAERARIERLARRGDAIETAMAAARRARAGGSGCLQPLLFDDIASEKKTMTNAFDESRFSWVSEPADASGLACERMASSLAMVLVLR